ncbi:hypothetical protein QQY66_49780 [Streptomyces sp. DG2A-72]|uniref:hypothetical protein n=1 Tax=Streptomyces sp. DG2A-72 TaxID=3051386 RepID=UPI00265BDCCF|nr:hypothetical protein [Streptomyces sp. DG2A-72]MDO0939398.1 hypothetical protein [Streptomyces sp. DG2A-72]
MSQARLGAPALHGCGKDADPLLVLTGAACEWYGLPAALQPERLAGRTGMQQVRPRRRGPRAGGLPGACGDDPAMRGQPEPGEGW